MALLEIKDLTFAYAGSNQNILTNISITVNAGEFLVLCGRSGCGKTTLLRQLKTVLAPAGTGSGSIRYHGKSLDDMTIREQTKCIGYVMQNPEHQIVTDKVWHELAFGLENLGYDTKTIQLRIAEMADYLGISRWYEKSVSELSGGQKQLMNLAAVLVMQPEVLILDEPTSQLDPLTAEEFLRILTRINEEFGITIIFCAHRLEEVYSHADRIVVMENGSIVAVGSPREIPVKLSDSDMKQALPVPVQVACMLPKTDLNIPITIREGKEYLNQIIVSDEFSNRKQIRSVSMQDREKSNRIILSAKDVWFRYEKQGEDVISDLNLNIHEGEIYALLGSNGSGKTTAISLLGGILKPYRGKIKLWDDKAKNRPDEALAIGKIAILPQDVQTIFVGDTVKEDLDMMYSNGKQSHKSGMESGQRMKELIEQMQLQSLLNEHPYDLSGGEAQRLALAKVLYRSPSILMLDEPTKGMDACYKKEFGRILLDLRNSGVTIVLISHDVEFVSQYADTCAMLFRGNIVAESPSHDFFAGNYFYSTAVNRMSRHLHLDAVTMKDLIECIRDSKRMP